MTSNTPYTIQTIQSLSDISQSDWDRLSGASKFDSHPSDTDSHPSKIDSNISQCESNRSEYDSETAYNPFISYNFLRSLEISSSVGSDAGWLPQHLILSNETGDILGAVPAYLKSHSQGEYVFDHAWADAWTRAGGRYYPKLQCTVPFTPATGPRLLVKRGADRNAIIKALAHGICQMTEQMNLSSSHVTFMPEHEAGHLNAVGYVLRHDQQFHFINDGYSHYSQFLDTLTSRKRKALKKERSKALENGITIDWLTGHQLTEQIWDIFYAFYIDTSSRKWGTPYLTREFFSQIGHKMADDIVLIMAKRDGRYMAGAINFIGSDCLYGRHWGCVEDHPFLHFEVCYHQAIDFAIAHKLSRVEAGAQGQHKLARGYLPATTFSAHYIPHEGFRRAVSDYLIHERQEIGEIGDILRKRGPFRDRQI